MTVNSKKKYIRRLVISPIRSTKKFVPLKIRSGDLIGLQYLIELYTLHGVNSPKS